MTLVLMTLTALAQEKNARLPQFFADGMVMQRDVKIPVWGWGQPGDLITVSLRAANSQKEGKKVKTLVAEDGTWKVYLPKQKAGGPYTLAVGEAKPNEKPTVYYVKEFRNILVGDVYLCSGQSNMELPIRRCMDKVADQVTNYTNKNIRYLKLPQQYNYVRPNDDVRILPWQDITPQNCGEVSGICYFMARYLQEKTGVPVGIINSSVGGTKVEAWMPNQVLAQYDGYAEELQQRKYHQEDWPDSIRRLENAAAFAWEQQMTATDTVVYRWKTDGYDFASWQTVDMFADWHHGKNGSYWFRTTVNLPASAAGKKALLRFGAMKDADSIFVNKTCVGNITYQYPPRVYNVKEGILHEGENEIVVHLMSQNGAPNFTKGKLYQLEVDGQTYPLSQQLQMAQGCIMPPKPSSTYFVDTPTGLFNAMIHPLQDYPIRGMLWYQGESNQHKPHNYADLMEGMVKAWRTQFKTDFPAVIVQLPAYMAHHNKPVETGWTQIRQQQMLAAQRISNAGLVPTLDTGEGNDIHPQDKDIVGRRAGLVMHRLVFGDNSADHQVAEPVSAKIQDGKVLITFRNTGNGLQAKGGELKEFAVQVNGTYQWTTATITSKNTVAVQLPEGITATSSVRYCWNDFPEATLFTNAMPIPQFEISVNK